MCSKWYHIPDFQNHIIIDFCSLYHQDPFLIKHQSLSSCDDHRETLFKVGEYHFIIRKS